MVAGSSRAISGHPRLRSIIAPLEETAAHLRAFSPAAVAVSVIALAPELLISAAFVIFYTLTNAIIGVARVILLIVKREEDPAKYLMRILADAANIAISFRNHTLLTEPLRTDDKTSSAPAATGALAPQGSVPPATAAQAPQGSAPAVKPHLDLPPAPARAQHQGPTVRSLEGDSGAPAGY